MFDTNRFDICTVMTFKMFNLHSQAFAVLLYGADGAIELADFSLQLGILDPSA